MDHVTDALVSAGDRYRDFPPGTAAAAQSVGNGPEDQSQKNRYKAAAGRNSQRDFAARRGGKPGARSTRSRLSRSAGGYRRRGPRTAHAADHLAQPHRRASDGGIEGVPPPGQLHKELDKAIVTLSKAKNAISAMSADSRPLSFMVLQPFW